MLTTDLSPAAHAFDAVADIFDSRFTPWLSVAAQRRAVRTALAAAFPAGARLIELGGGTGEDALWLAERDRAVLMTDASPTMVRIAAAKLAGHDNAAARILPAEGLETFALEAGARGENPFDGAYSNFAGLNCVSDLAPVARGLARLVRPGGRILLVLFGVLCPGEMIVESLRGRPRNALRRLAHGNVHARLGARDFTVRYHRAAALERHLRPWFQPAGRKGIGVFVPPSAAEPWISRHPRFLDLLETLDRRVSRALAVFGDHILYQFVRTDAGVAEAA